jgi:hypothetical protein
MENFVGSVAEETVNFVGVGEDRLAKKISGMDSLFNIAMGTTFGTALGAVLTNNGRKSLMRSFKRKYGSSAEELVKAKEHAVQVAMELGVDESKIVSNIVDIAHDYDKFGEKPHHNTVDTPPVEQQAEMFPHYLSKDADGAIEPYADPDTDGVIMTSNIHQAQNVGESYVQYDNSHLKLAKPEDMDKIIKGTGKWKIEKNTDTNEWHLYAWDEAEKKWEWSTEGDTKKQLTEIAQENLEHETLDTRIRKTLVSNFVDGLDEGGSTRLREMIIGDIASTKDDLKEELLDILHDAVGIEEIVATMENYAINVESNFNPMKAVDKVIDKSGYDGYTFDGKGATGTKQYTGIYLTKKGAKKSKKVKETTTPKPNFVHKAKMEMIQQDMFEGYTDHLDQHGLVIKASADAEMLGLVTDPLIVPGKSELTSKLLGNDEKIQVMQSQLDEIQAEIDAGKILTDDQKAAYVTLKKAFDNVEKRAVVNENAAKVEAFLRCKYGE